MAKNSSSSSNINNRYYRIEQNISALANAPAATMAITATTAAAKINISNYIISNLYPTTDWAAMATRSTRPDILGFPFANVFSVSDGVTTSDSSGVPYMYLTPMEMSVKDLKKDNRASLTMSLAQGKYCNTKHLDPEDPRCAHVILTGQVTKLKANSTEEAFAKRALFSRHPEMTQWPKGYFCVLFLLLLLMVLDVSIDILILNDLLPATVVATAVLPTIIVVFIVVCIAIVSDHTWFFAKLDLVSVLVLDYFGGVKVVTKEQYFDAKQY